ncbi:MAG: hypothetical protein RLZZ174_1740 [Pseudomonadota bacterium]|jgi:myo-inositol-1(or 4)-monophosphatase|nr:inositol monophosphatase [Pseudomonadales bacterium]MBL6807986.1 inositol monophosphatase [Pseudomonadales bacterium]MDA0954677.1 inositol monophosphatase family protein [Pseudomonadota bacterium]
MQPLANMALRAARKAGQIIVRALDRVDRVNAQQKHKNDWVSDVDRAAEASIIETLSTAYPDHGFLGEESGHRAGLHGEYTWIIDPLDGTTNFLRGVPHFCISIACQHNGRLEHAVVFDPLRDEAFVASRGYGAQLNDKRIRVTKHLGLDGALIGTGIPYRESATLLQPYLGMLGAITPEVGDLRRAGSAALDLAYVAAGRFDGYWELGLKPWDLAAGALLVTEAGGLVSDLAGGSQFLRQGHIVCGTPKVFKGLLQKIAPHVTAELKGA